MLFSLYQIDKAEQQRQQAAPIPEWQVVHPADVAGGFGAAERRAEVASHQRGSTPSELTHQIDIRITLDIKARYALLVVSLVGGLISRLHS